MVKSNLHPHISKQTPHTSHPWRRGDLWSFEHHCKKIVIMLKCEWWNWMLPWCFFLVFDHRKRKDRLTVLLPFISATCQLSVCVRCRPALSRYIVSQLWVIFSPFFPPRLNDFISAPPPPHHLSVCLSL